MKKFLAMILALVFLFSMVACNSPTGNGGNNSNNSSSSGEGDVPTDLTAVTVVKVVGNNWFDSMNWETDKWCEAVKSQGINVENHYYGPPAQDSAQQIPFIMDAVAMNPDILFVTPIATDAVDEQTAIALENGAIVITHEGAAMKNKTYNVDPFTEHDYGAHFADVLVGERGSTGKVAVTVASLTEASHNAWANGFMDQLESEYPGWESITGRNYIESGAGEETYSVIKQLLQAYPDLDAIFMPAGSGAVSAARAIEEMGLAGKVGLYANGGTADKSSAWESGVMTHGCMHYPGYSAAAGYEVALRVLQGIEIKTGDNLGVTGYESIIVDGNNIYGSGWLDVTADNWKEMAELL